MSLLHRITHVVPAADGWRYLRINKRGTDVYRHIYPVPFFAVVDVWTCPVKGDRCPRVTGEECPYADEHEERGQWMEHIELDGEVGLTLDLNDRERGKLLDPTDDSDVVDAYVKQWCEVEEIEVE